MPLRPEFPNAGGAVGMIEIKDKVIAEPTCHAASNIGVPAKVTIDLDGKHEPDKPPVQTGMGHTCCAKGRIDCRSKIIGKNHLFEIAFDDQIQPDPCRFFGDGFILCQLWQKLGCAFNGAGYQLRPERNVGKEMQDICRRFQCSAVGGNGVAERLERIKTDPDGERPLHDWELIGQAHRFEQQIEVRAKESRVFKRKQQPQIADERERDEQPLVLRHSQHSDSCKKVDEAIADQQQEPPGSRPGIKNKRKSDEIEVPDSRYFLCKSPSQKK